FAIAIQLDGLSGKSATMEVDPATLGVSYDDPINAGQTAKAKPIDGNIVLMWMRGAGVDMPSPQIADEAQVIADIVQKSVQLGEVGGPTYVTGRLERIVAKQRDGVNEAIATYPFKPSRGTASDVYGPAWGIYWLS